MSGDRPEEDAKEADMIRRQSLCTHLIKDGVILEPDKAPTYGFSPDYAFEDAVTEMVLGHNASIEKGIEPIPAGYALRVRVVCGGEDGIGKAPYSQLDRLVFDGERAKSLFPGTEQTSLVGKFAILKQDSEGGFIPPGDVLLQIASYGVLKRKAQDKGINPATDKEWKAFLAGDETAQLP